MWTLMTKKKRSEIPTFRLTDENLFDSTRLLLIILTDFSEFIFLNSSVFSWLSTRKEPNLKLEEKIRKI